jgi:MFS family permease
VTGLVLQSAGLLWLGLLLTSGTPYIDMVPAFVLAGIGMTLFFVPLASLVLGSVPPSLEGVASGTNSAFRELGGVLGIAVLGAVFSSSGSYVSAQDYVNGLRPAILVGAVAVLLGTFTALLVPALRRGRTAETSRGVDAAGSSHPQDERPTSHDLITAPLGSAA